MLNVLVEFIVLLGILLDMGHPDIFVLGPPLLIARLLPSGVRDQDSPCSNLEQDHEDVIRTYGCRLLMTLTAAIAFLAYSSATGDEQVDFKWQRQALQESALIVKLENLINYSNLRFLPSP